MALLENGQGPGGQGGGSADREPSPLRATRGPVAILTGSGTYALPGLQRPSEELVPTEFGAVELTRGELAGVDVVHVSRHGDGHPRLSHQVNHRGNVAALRELGVGCAVALTICGAVDPDLARGELVVFDDLHFPSNRLADGSVCTLHARPGEPDRAHWIFDRPFSESLRAAIRHAARSRGHKPRTRGCYGHVDGPRFNTRTEVRALHALGVTAISQSAGPEVVLCGEAGIPYALLGYITDHANGAAPRRPAVERLMSGIGSSAEVFAALVEPLVLAAGRARPTTVGENRGFEDRPDLYSSASSSAAVS